MSTTSLMTHYRRATATGQAAFLTTALGHFANHGMIADYGQCATLDLARPRCPKCHKKVTHLVEYDVSYLAQEAEIATDDDGKPYISAQCAVIGDYHPMFFVTACCDVAVLFPAETRIEFS